MTATQYPYQSPVSRPNEDAGRLPLWEHLLFATVVLASIAYSLMCAVRIYALNSFVDIANQELRGAGADAGHLASVLRLEQQSNTALQVTFWAMYVLFIGWMITLNRRFAAAGQGGRLRRLPAMVTWRVGVFASLALVLFVNRQSGPTSLSDIPHVAHTEMIYLTVRLAIGCVYVWCAFAMRGAALSLRAPAPAMSQPAVVIPAQAASPAAIEPMGIIEPPAAIEPTGVVEPVAATES